MADVCCAYCYRGREACEYCHDIAEEDWAAICDCGLHDFGHHLNPCEDRDDKRFVVVANYGSEDLPRDV
jgi:hypothetical protein